MLLFFDRREFTGRSEGRLDVVVVVVILFDVLIAVVVVILFDVLIAIVVVLLNDILITVVVIDIRSEQTSPDIPDDNLFNSDKNNNNKNNNNNNSNNKH